LLEVALNRRLAPDIYLGVADIAYAGGDRCDSLVVMRRLPAARSLDRLVRDGVDVTDTLRALARQLAAFPAGWRHSQEVAQAGGPEMILASWQDNCAEMAQYAARGLLDPTALEAVGRLGGCYVRGRQRLFEQRVEAGHIRDGHGDLLAEDIFVLESGA